MLKFDLIELKPGRTLKTEYTNDSKRIISKRNNVEDRKTSEVNSRDVVDFKQIQSSERKAGVISPFCRERYGAIHEKILIS